MWKFAIFLLAGLVLASIFLAGISSAAGDKGDEGKGEVKEEGYRLTPADKHSQLLSILIILAIMALTI